MSLTYYNVYLENLAMSPDAEYRSGLQALVDAQWENTTTRYTIQEEVGIGSLVYQDIEVYINHVVNESTTGRKNGDDFRQIIFKEIVQSGEKSTRNQRGQLYRFDNNYWLTTFTDNYNGDSVSIVVRRCNNMAKFIDKETGDIISVPCVLDYTVTSAAPKYTEDIVTPDNYVVIIVQGNERTLPWKQNQRFLFNGRPFKITGFNNYMQNEYITESTTILYFDAYLDEIQPTDDLVNGVANRFEYNYVVNILQDNFSAIKGDTGTLTAEVKLNNEVVERPILWSCNPPIAATIDENGNYTILAEPGISVEFKAATSQYATVQDTITCSVVESLPDNKTLVVEGLSESVSQGQSLTFGVYIYNNGVKEDTISSVITYQLLNPLPSSQCFTFTRLNFNEFKITNKQMSQTPLKIMFKSEGIPSVEISVKLKSAF